MIIRQDSEKRAQADRLLEQVATAAFFAKAVIAYSNDEQAKTLAETYLRSGAPVQKYWNGKPEAPKRKAVAHAAE